MAALYWQRLIGGVVLNPHAEAWYAQSLDDALRDYDFTAVMAMPYMEQARDHTSFLTSLVAAVKQRPLGLDRVLFELQSTDWRKGRNLSSAELADQIRLLCRLGAHHLGYYPVNLHRGTPDPALIQPLLTVHSSERAGAWLPTNYPRHSTAWIYPPCAAKRLAKSNSPKLFKAFTKVFQGLPRPYWPNFTGIPAPVA